MPRPQPIRCPPRHPCRRPKRLSRHYLWPAFFNISHHESMVAQPLETSDHAIMNQSEATVRVSAEG
jgi:hypothetical protein